MITAQNEKKCLQLAVMIGCLVPLLAGAAGVLQGTHFMRAETAIGLDSHFRYLSGLLLGIGIGFLGCVRRIEHKTLPFRLLTFIVFIGGLSRLAGFFLNTTPGNDMIAAIIMEIIVTPALCLWQARIAARWENSSFTG